jgi:hypothetical protein
MHSVPVMMACMHAPFMICHCHLHACLHLHSMLIWAWCIFRLDCAALSQMLCFLARVNFLTRLLRQVSWLNFLQSCTSGNSSQLLVSLAPCTSSRKSASFTTPRQMQAHGRARDVEYGSPPLLSPLEVCKHETNVHPINQQSFPVLHRLA